jgi:cold shock CspA family protein
MPRGRIKWFNENIGAGFIRSDEGENIFFRFNAVLGADPRDLRRDQCVRFVVAKSARSLSRTASRVLADDLRP